MREDKSLVGVLSRMNRQFRSLETSMSKRGGRREKESYWELREQMIKDVLADEGTYEILLFLNF